MTWRGFRVLVAAVLLACVLVILVAPYVDLPLTTLRARAAALFTQLALLIMASLLWGFHSFNWALRPTAYSLPPPASPSPDMTCSWLC